MTGFERFLGNASNPSWAGLVRMMELRPELKKRVAVGSIPVVYGTAAIALKELVTRYEPRMVICLGMHGGVESSGRGLRTFYVERFAYNLDDCPAPDNAGNVRRDQPIVRSQSRDASLASTIDSGMLLEGLMRSGAQAAVSDNPGRYLCNHLYFHALLHSQVGGGKPQAGFIHVPPSSDLKDGAFSLDEMATKYGDLAAHILSVP